MKDEELVFDHTGAVDVEALREYRDTPRTQYEPPPADVEMWRMFRAIGVLRLNGSQKAVLTCLLDHANPRTGRCDPSQERIATLLGLHIRTVEKAIAALLRTPYLRRERRGQSSNAYRIQWEAVIRADRQYREQWQYRTNGRIRTEQPFGSVPNKRADEKEKRKGKEKREPERDDLPNGKCVHQFEVISPENQGSKNKPLSEWRGREVSKGNVVQPLNEPTGAAEDSNLNWWRERLAAAQRAISKADTEENRQTVARLENKIGELKGRREAA